MAQRVKITKWEPVKEAMTITTHHAVPDPAKLARIAVVKLQLALIGNGCGCHRVEELVALLRDLGVEVQIEEGPGGNSNAN
jgi:hypothetical protein